MANLRIAELDFDLIKTNLKAFLKSQSEFSDYDFEGSGLSVLIDILSYNTHYNAYLANMLANEMFLDSAVKRSSAVSIAKQLGYTPRSARGARATIDVVVDSPTGSPPFLTMDRYTPFTTTIDGEEYTFLTVEEKTTEPISGVYTFSDVEVVEGIQQQFTYTVVSPGPGEKYVIPNDNIDTTTLTVTVQNSSIDTTLTSYSQATDITGISSTSQVYFLEENPQERYQIYFGDGIIGKKLSPGNIVIIQYLIVNGADGNVSSEITQSFTAGTTIGGSSSITVDTVTNSTSGAGKEDIVSIKYNAPQVNAARNRAVTVEDYKALISAYFSEAESVAVWGGEDNDPPKYGKILISLKPYSGYTISQLVKDSIANDILRSRKVLAIQPEFVDPDYTYINLEFYVKYNPNITTSTSDQIRTNITNVVNNYFTTNLQKFNRSFNCSRLVADIVNSSTAITSSVFRMKLQKRFEIILNTTYSYTGASAIKYRSKLRPGEVTSSRFYITKNGVQTLVRFADLPSSAIPSEAVTGTIQLLNAYTGVIVESNAGSVNYTTGEISLNTFTITGYTTGVNDLRITAGVEQTEYYITALTNQILLLDDSTRDPVAGREAGLVVNVTPLVE